MSRDGPFIIGLKHRRTDEADDRVVVREDADHIRAALAGAVHPFQRVRAGDLGPVLAGEGHIGQNVVRGAFHPGAEFGLLLAQGVGYDVPLGVGFGIGPCANIVFSTAATAVRCSDGAWVRAFRIQ